jgi:hypothetical protein
VSAGERAVRRQKAGALSLSGGSMEASGHTRASFCGSGGPELGVALHGRCASPVAGRSSPPPSPMQQHALAWQRKGSAQLAVTDRARPGARLDGPCRARVRAWSMRTHRCDRRELLRGRLVIAQTSPEAVGGTGSSRAPLLRFRTLTSELVRTSCPGWACREGGEGRPPPPRSLPAGSPPL